MALVVFALALLGIPYGSGSGAAQRGPKSFDCIGFVRWCLLHVAPQLWPTARGGEDSWTVPNFLDWWTRLGLGPVLPPSAVPFRGDILIFGASEHIGIADDAGNAVSAHSAARGVCSIPIGSMGLPLTYILRTGLEQDMPIPIGVARTGIDPATRAVRSDGSLAGVPLGLDVVVYGEETAPAPHAEPSYRIADRDGSTLWLLVRNTSAYTPMSSTPPDASSAALQAKITAAIAALS
jgi:hypothetical protein